MNPKRIVIAGGTGFLGRRLAATLAGVGYEIVVLSRGAPRAPVGPVQFVTWQPEHPEQPTDWVEHLEGAHALVNLCGESIGGPRWGEARKRRLLDSRVIPTRALVQAVNDAASPPSLFVQSSGVGYYGTGDESRTETDPAGEDFLARLAVEWEAPLVELRGDVRAVIARMGVVLGNTGGALGQMLMPFRMLVGGPIASGNQWLSWIHLHDFSAAITHLLTVPGASGIFNVTSPEPVRNHQFAKTAGVALARPAWMFTPRFVLKALLGEQCTLVCDGQQVLPERLITDGFSFRFPTMESALADLV